MQREEALKKSEQMLEEDALRFDAFLKENDEKVQEAIKKAEVEAKAKQDKVHITTFQLTTWHHSKLWSAHCMGQNGSNIGPTVTVPAPMNIAVWLHLQYQCFPDSSLMQHNLRHAHRMALNQSDLRLAVHTLISSRNPKVDLVVQCFHDTRGA